MYYDVILFRTFLLYRKGDKKLLYIQEKVIPLHCSNKQTFKQTFKNNNKKDTEYDTE